jgi:predicted ATP-grasp superfamily ATP-dependent carboligase
VTILVAAVSGRALASAARRAGAEVIVADFFGDIDTRAMAAWVPLPGNLEEGIDLRGLAKMVDTWQMPVDGVVYSGGFESDPLLLHELKRLAPLLGNAPEVVGEVKNPNAFAALLGRLGLPHPRVSDRPMEGADWLRKKRGGAGGTHIRHAQHPSLASDGRYYYQEFVPGCPVSALFVADGRAARVIGFSEQWSAPTASSPFRFGGCAAPLPTSRDFATRIEAACSAIAAAVGLVGLNSLDMLVLGDDVTILEVNPRPGATLNVFDDPTTGLSLWRAHLESVAGALPAGPVPPARSARAAAIVYASETLRVAGSISWPSWVADIPVPLTVIPAHAPVCTVLAEAGDLATARERARQRGETVLQWLEPLSQRLPETA